MKYEPGLSIYLLLNVGLDDINIEFVIRCISVNRTKKKSNLPNYFLNVFQISSFFDIFFYPGKMQIIAEKNYELILLSDKRR